MAIPNEQLQRARLEKRWSVAAASRKVGVSTNTFNRWERGLQIPQLATLDQLCETFDMSAENLGFGEVVAPRKKVELECVPMDELEGTVCVCRSPGSLLMLDAPPVLNMAPDGHRESALARPLEASRGPVGMYSRRQLIAALIGTPAAVFGVRQNVNLSLLRAAEVLSLCTAHVPLCWQLYFEGGMLDVEPILANYITQLTVLTQASSPYQVRAATLLSQSYQLDSLIATQHQDYGKACASARQALFYGEMARDPNLQVASLIRSALAFFYLKRPRPCLQAYQRAFQLVSQVSPLLVGRTYAGLAEAWSQLGEEQVARHCLDLAWETFPPKAEEDPNYACTHFTFTSISTFEGLMHLHLKQPGQAQKAFARIDLAISQDSSPNRLELLVHQALTACSLGNLEQTAELIGRAVPMARVLGSQLRLDQAYEVYEQMLSRWGQERLMRDLEEVFGTEYSPVSETGQPERFLVS